MNYQEMSPLKVGVYGKRFVTATVDGEVTDVCRGYSTIRIVDQAFESLGFAYTNLVSKIKRDGHMRKLPPFSSYVRWYLHDRAYEFFPRLYNDGTSTGRDLCEEISRQV